MGNDGKIEERKRLNAPFIKAFDWIRAKKNLTQDEMAKRLESNGSLMSLYRNGKKLAGEDIKDRLATAFSGKLYRPFLDGLSPYMLIDNVPDAERRRNLDRDNPDFEQLQKDKLEQSRQRETEGAASIIELCANLVKELETMRSDFASDLHQVQALKYELTHEREILQSITTQLQTVLHPSVKYDIPTASLQSVAEPTKNIT